MHSRPKPHLLFFLLSCGYVFAHPLSDCPCPGDKWMPPFRASQLIYSEFPEDRARSLNLNRRESFPYPYETKSKTLPLQGRNYPDYDVPKDYSNEYASQSIESDDYLKYNGYNDYKEEKEEEPYDFTLESFELDPEVMSPPPPPEEDETKENSNSADENEPQESTDPPTTQLEVPATESPPENKVAPIPPPHSSSHHLQQNQQPMFVKVSGYPLNRTPVPTFRNPALPHGLKPWPGMERWKSVLAEREMSSLQFMKPPPLGQAQTWARPIHHKFRPRPNVIYL